jgi:glycosyltransferase involved in cell wall biosynthesis
MSKNTPSVSVVIPSLYEIDHEYLKLCVESLRATTDWNIIVVTNGSSVKPILPFLCTHLHTRDQGQCNAVNIGAQVATGDYLMVSNSDMYYAPGWDSALSEKDWPLCFSPNLVEPTNNHGSASPFLKLDAGFTLEEFNKDKVDKFVELHRDEVAEPGFNLPFFIKRDLFNFLGGYDVAYDPWGSNSDTDLQTRINLAGITPMRLRDVLVYHFSNKTPTFSPENDKFRQFNFDYFYDKFGFDRDELGSDVWHNKDMIPEDKGRIKFKQGKYYE